MAEIFEWVAVLADGSCVKMGDIVDGHEISSTQLDPNKVIAIQLLPLTPEGQKITVIIQVNRGERFVRFWRQIVTPNSQVRVNVIGIKTHDDVEYRLYVSPDGSIVMSSEDLYGELFVERCKWQR
jgi:hypothetical protein